MIISAAALTTLWGSPAEVTERVEHPEHTCVSSTLPDHLPCASTAPMGRGRWMVARSPEPHARDDRNADDTSG